MQMACQENFSNVVLTTFKIAIFVLALDFQIQMIEARHRRHTRSDEREFQARKEDIKNNWSCGVPKKTLVYLYDEKPELNGIANVKWFPAAAVVHRCESRSGCCDSYPNQRCEAMTSEPILVIFQKISRDRRLREITYQRVEFRNHTSCGCDQILLG